jgi:hypothetical protein
MELKTLLYVAILPVVIATQSSCKSTLPNIHTPEGRAQLQGTYRKTVDKVTATYIVDVNGWCSLASKWKQDGISRSMYIFDEGCNNTLDQLNFKQKRGNLHEEDITFLDNLLETFQKELVKPENKI